MILLPCHIPTVGITSNGPGGEFNGLIGLAEGLLYSLRLYIKVIEKMVKADSSNHDVDALLKDANARLQGAASLDTIIIHVNVSNI